MHAIDAHYSLPPHRIVQPVDDKVRVTLHGAVRPLANPHNDRGLAPDHLPMERMQLILRRSGAQQADLEHLIRDLHNPGSLNYHCWLTPEEFGERFGPSDRDIETVKSWLKAHGFSGTRLLPGKQVLEFSGDAKKVAETFHVSIHKYDVNGSSHYASATDPQIPAALSPVIGGFVSLDNFHSKRLSHVLRKSFYGRMPDKSSPQWTNTSIDGSNNYIISPADLSTQYDLAPLYGYGIKGDGQTIAVINDSNINVALVDQFQQLFGLPHNLPQIIIDGEDPGIDGINNPDGPNYDSVEAYLDVEWANAVAPDATVDLVIAGDTSGTPGLFLAAERAVADNVASIISVSFSSCERSLASSNEFFAMLWSQAAAQGITVVVSAGDSGAAGCDLNEDFAVGGRGVNGIASTPYDIAVGGTDFYYSSWNEGASAKSSQLSAYWDQNSTNSPEASMKSPIPEQPWNDSQYGLNLINYYADVSGSSDTTIRGGGGGASSCTKAIYDSYGSVISCTAGYEKPQWQSGTGVPDDRVRDIPDVSLFAGDGVNHSFYPICASDGDCESPFNSTPVQVTGAGGTSFAAPAFAAVMALVNQRYGRQGQADFVLYPLARQFPDVFRDVAVGDNAVPCFYSDSFGDPASTDCIAASDSITVDFGSLSVTEGELGVSSTPSYRAVPGYDLATGLGTVDANSLLSRWDRINFAGTELTLNLSATSFTHGTPINLSGSVTAVNGVPTGQVSLITDSNNASGPSISLTVLDSLGHFNATVDNLPGGTYNIWGEYGGDGTSGPSSSTKTLVSVTPEKSDIALGAYYGGQDQDTGTALTGQSVAYGQPIYLRAAVVPASYYSTCLLSQNPPTSCNTMDVTPASGTVTFVDNGNDFDTSALNGQGVAEIASDTLSPGLHNISASYSGDFSYYASTTPAIAFTVARSASQISSSANYSSISAGQEVVLTVRVTGGWGVSSTQSVPTGAVTLNGAPSGVPVSETLAPSQAGGVALFAFPADIAPGSYNLTISYSGDTNYEGAVSQQTIRIGALSKLPSTIVTTSTATATSPTAGIAIHVAVTGQPGQGPPTGIVDFSSSGYDLGNVRLAPGDGVTSDWSGIWNSQTLLGGENLITAQYEGDATYAPSATTLDLSNPLSDFLLVPDRTAVPLAANTSGTIVVYLSSFNGFGGTIEFTCFAAPGITCTPSSSNATLLSNGRETITLNIAASSTANSGNNNVLLTAVSGALTHTLGLAAFVRSNVPDGFMIANNGDITVVRGETMANTTGITISPMGQYSGTVDLNCQVSSALAGTNSPTCQVNSPVKVASGQSASSTLSIDSTVDTSAGAYSVTVTGRDAVNGALSNSTAVRVIVDDSGFSLSNSGSIVIHQGASKGNTSTISIAPLNGFKGTVHLSCNVTPNQASSVTVPACSLPSSIDIAGTSPQSAILSVSLDAVKTTAKDSRLRRALSSSSGAAIVMVLVFFPLWRREKRLWKSALKCMAILAIATLGCTGCAEFTSMGGEVFTSSEKGTYTVNVTGSANNQSSGTVVLVTVQ
jgi:trimeric autotransporter adhesin